MGPDGPEGRLHVHARERSPPSTSPMGPIQGATGPLPSILVRGRSALRPQRVTSDCWAVEQKANPTQLALGLSVVAGVLSLCNCGGDDQRPASAAKQTITVLPDRSPPAHLLAGLDAQSTELDPAAVKPYEVTFTRLVEKCPNDKPSRLADFAVVAQEDMPGATLLEIIQAADEAIPSAPYPAESCAEIFAMLVTLQQAGL